jgi:signal transduction histidine kinase
MNTGMQPNHGRTTILVIEDSLTQAEKLKHILEGQGYRVRLARNGMIGLADMRIDPPALVLSDIVMPEMNGYELCQRIRSEANTCDLPVILLTSLSNQQDVVDGLACGADGFITKPYSAEYLLAHIERTLADHASHQGGREEVELPLPVTGRLISANPRRMVSLFLSTYEAAVFRNEELAKTQDKLSALNEHLEEQVEERTAALKADIIEREHAEQANLAKSEFLSRMSHELRTPLNAILGFAQLLESDVPPPRASQKKCITQILSAGWHLLGLINEVLDLSKIESGQVPLTEEPVALADVMLECQSMIVNQARQGELTLHFPDFDLPIFVRADRTRVKQVLINLLSNAVKYNRKQGTVQVTCFESTPGRIRVSIRDTGEGLTPEQLAQLFQAFNRLGRENSETDGTGIGLVVAKRLVELMGGEIGVESSLGVGSVFWFELNAIAEPHSSVEACAAAPAAPSNAPCERGQHTILYVEDNPANLELVSQLVGRRPDLCLLGAVDATMGLRLAREKHPEVILMDINLPGMSGIQAMKLLRENPSTEHIPVIALSAAAMTGDIKKGMDEGFFRYLTKPIVVSKLMQTIDEALEYEGNATLGSK